MQETDFISCPPPGHLSPESLSKLGDISTIKIEDDSACGETIQQLRDPPLATMHQQKERPRPIANDNTQTVFLPDEGKDRPACQIHVSPGTNLALRRLLEVTDKDYAKALLAPILMSCRGCSKSFPGVARLTELLMHLDSKQHSKTCGVTAEENPLYQIALETTATKKKSPEEMLE